MSQGSSTPVYRVIGLMSGTSLDGVDLALCEFRKADTWSYKIVRAETVPFQMIWKNKLETAYGFSGFELTQLDRDFGGYLGALVDDFRQGEPVDFVASHGHTVFHKPDLNLTSQIGHPATIVAGCGLPVIGDFRSQDVANGGQGAPLVPMGDKLLFGEYDYCLNMGGFANVSYERDGVMHAFDVCPVNTVMNRLARELNHEFDRDGEFARAGALKEPLLNRLNNVSFYQRTGPKSLGREWLESIFLPTLDRSTASPNSKLRTFVEHVAIQMGRVMNEPDKKVLVTGGGALNTYLMERLQEHCAAQLIVPDETLVQFKEAMIFAFLGVLRRRLEVNVLGSVTGGRDHSAGAIYHV